MEEATVKFFVSYLNKKNELSKIQQVDLSSEDPKIIELHSKVADAFGISSDSFDIYFGSKCLQATDCNMKDVGLLSGMKLYAVQRKTALPTPTPTTPPDYEVVRNAMYGLTTMFAHSRRSRQRNKTAIIKFLEDEEAIADVIKSIDGLADNQIALDILGNNKLLEVILDPKNATNVLENHPCLAHAFVAIWNKLMSSSKYSNFEPVTAMSDSQESQESMEVDGSQPHSRAEASTSSQNSITSSQLAAALAQTFSTQGNDTTVASPLDAAASGSSNQRNTNRPIVTPEAMQQALMTTGYQQVSESLLTESVPSTSSTTVSEDAIKSGLNQLKAMGITDEAVCRQALIATQGNVEAAINIIFSGS